MDMIRMEAVKDGRLFVVERKVPDMRGFVGKMSTYCAMHGTVNRMLWELAAKIEEGSGDQHVQRHVNAPQCKCGLCTEEQG
jgi:hypothetical protein